MTSEHVTLLAALLTPGGILGLIVQKWFAERALEHRASEAKEQFALETARLVAQLAVDHKAVVAKIEENTELTKETKVAIEAKVTV